MNGLPWWFTSGLGGALDGQHLDSIDPGGKASRLLAPVPNACAVVHVSSRVARPGVVRVLGVDRLILGEPGAHLSPRTADLARIINAGGAACPPTSDIRLEIWAKLWGNMNMNPVSALTRRTANGILGDPRLLGLVREMMTEFATLGERIGIRLPMTVDERLVITRRLGDFRTSMLNDVEAGRPLEIEGLLGVVVEIAEKLGHPIPASRAVYALARTLDAPV
jgi:2-dehydropantoate 2-reductase